MVRLTIRNLLAHRRSFASTTLALVIGVGFVVSSFVLADGFRERFAVLSSDIVGGLDLAVRPDAEFGQPRLLDPSTPADLNDVDGVANAAGRLLAEGIQPIRGDGEAVTTAGPPLLGYSWVDDPALNNFEVVEGRAPRRGLEFALDEHTASAGEFVVGESYGMVTPSGRSDLVLVGVTRFGTDGVSLGAVRAQFPLETARDLFDRPTGFTSVLIRLDSDAEPESVAAEIEQRLPENVEVLTKSEIVDETRAGFNATINAFGSAMLAFAGIALFVSTFMIANTFAVVLGQRTRELALLRVVGASSQQLRRSTLGEALLIGLVASGLGTLAGIGFAHLIKAVLGNLPDADIVVGPRTIVLAFTLGIGVTMLSAVGPVRRATSGTTMAALRDDRDAPNTAPTTGPKVGVLLLLGGAVGATWATLRLHADDGAGLIPFGIGAAVAFIGVVLIGPLAARPAVFLVGLPLRLLGIPGKLASRNAARNLRRTTSASMSLMIGLAFVTTAVIIGESVKQDLSSRLERSINADFIASSDNSIPAQFVDDFSSLQTVDTATGYRTNEIRLDGTVHSVTGTDLTTSGELVDFVVTGGALDDQPDTIVVHRDMATVMGLAIGDQVEIEFPAGPNELLTVRAIFESQNVLKEDFLLPIARWEERFETTASTWVAARLTPDTTSQEARAALETVSREFPQVKIEDRIEFRESQQAGIGQVVEVTSALLTIAIIIALLNIANTLALSILERTREIGLLRATGMTRRQARQMIRWEAVQIALFGSALGTTIGLLFGWGTVKALPTSLTESVAIPFANITLLVAVAALSSLVAAAFPARRAAKLPVLDAIATS